MKSPACLIAALLTAVAPVLAQDRIDPHQWKMSATDSPTQISDHVWRIKGNPNLAVIVGTRFVLVVDTGLGPKMGAIAAGFAAKLAPGRRVMLTTTHFHPEHAAGENGFPEDTTLIRNDVQEMEVERYGMDMVKLFAARSDEFRGLLEHAAFRRPDVIFHDQVKVDLGGGVIARLLWLGRAHTEGDELIFVEPDATLVSGDVVQNATIPNIFTGSGKGGTPTSWLRVVDEVAKLHPVHILLSLDGKLLLLLGNSYLKGCKVEAEFFGLAAEGLFFALEEELRVAEEARIEGAALLDHGVEHAGDFMGGSGDGRWGAEFGAEAAEPLAERAIGAPEGLGG